MDTFLRTTLFRSLMWTLLWSITTIHIQRTVCTVSNFCDMVFWNYIINHCKSTILSWQHLLCTRDCGSTQTDSQIQQLPFPVNCIIGNPCHCPLAPLPSASNQATLDRHLHACINRVAMTQSSRQQADFPVLQFLTYRFILNDFWVALL